MGVRKIMPDSPPDLVLSGVNRGQNVAEDVTYSGTIAAAMEGTLLGVPSIALSQAYRLRRARAERPLGLRRSPCAGPDPQEFARAGIPPGVLVNVNFPGCAAAGGRRASRSPCRDGATRGLAAHRGAAATAAAFLIIGSDVRARPLQTPQDGIGHRGDRRRARFR